MMSIEPTDAMLDAPLWYREHYEEQLDDGLDPDEVRADMGLDDDDD
jgi:hypothetical protein